MTRKQTLDVGERVLAGLSLGRQTAIDLAKARSAEKARLIDPLLEIDIAKGRPARGRAGRIRLRLEASGIFISESQVRRIISSLLMSVEDSVGV